MCLFDGVLGIKGISLFMVLKFILIEDGELGECNSLWVVSFEYKLGLYGLLIVVMSYEGVKGWFVGKEYGGMVVMFIMMNNVCLGVGI